MEGVGFEPRIRVLLADNESGYGVGMSPFWDWRIDLCTHTQPQG